MSIQAPRLAPLSSLLAVLPFLAAALTTPLAAQVPPGSGVRFAATDPFPTLPTVVIVDPATGARNPVSELSADGSQAFAGAIDPSNGRLILGGGGGVATAGELRRVRLNGATVTGETLIADVGSESVRDVALDRDGNYIVLESTRLLLVSRQTSQVTVLDTDVYEGGFAALAVDPELNRAWVATSTNTAFENNMLLEYDLDGGPGLGVLLTDMFFQGQMGMPEGLAYDGQNALYLSGTDFFGGPPLVRYSLTGGDFTELGDFPFGVAFAGVQIDRRDGQVHFIERTPWQDPAHWFVVGPEGGVPVPAATFPPAQEYACALALNDFIDTTTVYPRRPSASAPTVFELAAHGLPGDLGFLAVTEANGSPIAPLILGIGTMNSGGFYTLSFALPPGVLPAGLAFTILSARRDAGGHMTLGTEAEVLVVP